MENGGYMVVRRTVAMPETHITARVFSDDYVVIVVVVVVCVV